VTATTATAPPAPAGRRFSVGPAVGLLPFLAFLGIFLIIPTVTVLVGAFQDDEGGFSLEKVSKLTDETPLHVLRESLVLSLSSSVVGAVLGALLAYLVVTASPTSLLRRVVTATCGVLAQFGGVTLAFAWIATLGFNGLLTKVLADTFGTDPNGISQLYELPGLVLVYTYFQIPLMVIVFLPALEGLRPQWREAAVNLGATTWQYWTQVALPLLRPAFLGSMLLLFANAFAAYATAAALISQGSPILPLLIRNSITSEIVLGQQNFAYALALEMVVVVAIVMALYAWLLKRTSKWLS
jgi:putative spermidine/putrescine transport system permease protein